MGAYHPRYPQRYLCPRRDVLVGILGRHLPHVGAVPTRQASARPAAILSHGFGQASSSPTCSGCPATLCEMLTVSSRSRPVLASGRPHRVVPGAIAVHWYTAVICDGRSGFFPPSARTAFRTYVGKKPWKGQPALRHIRRGRFSEALKASAVYPSVSNTTPTPRPRPRPLLYSPAQHTMNARSHGQEEAGM